ncbi:MAG: hypothetical protein KBD78_17185 [Oligoflexales bacterium]|nr:hypothetical protein [Oligoflexales bacterium]
MKRLHQQNADFVQQKIEQVKEQYQTPQTSAAGLSAYHQNSAARTERIINELAAVASLLNMTTKRASVIRPFFID